MNEIVADEARGLFYAVVKKTHTGVLLAPIVVAIPPEIILQLAANIRAANSVRVSSPAQSTARGG